jgi:integrase
MAAALNPRYAVLSYLGAGTGMRQAEMFGLAVDDIELDSARPTAPACWFFVPVSS